MKLVIKSKETRIERIGIGLASPEQIQQWANRRLPNGDVVGQITSSETVNYKTLRPVKDGFFCERIFGPIKDFECACGRKRPKKTQKFCPDCDVEYTWSKVRRHRLGYIQLNSPVTHVWYLKGRLNYFSILLGLRRKRVETITYCTEKLEFYETRILNINASAWKGSGGLPTYYYHRYYPAKITYPATTLRGGKITYNEIEGDITYSPVTTIKNYRERIIDKETVRTDDKIKYTEIERNNGRIESTEVEIDRRFQKFSQQQILPISQTFSWESEKDRNIFLDYFTPSPKEGDIPISTYSGVVENSEINLSALSLTSRESVQEVLANTGALAISKRLRQLELMVLMEILQDQVAESNEEINEYESLLESQGFLIRIDERLLHRWLAFRSKTIRRLKLVIDFISSRARPQWMTLSTIPVLPPDLRPIIPLDGDQVAVSDLNKLYQRIFFRNTRLRQTNRENALFTQRLLQEAVDALIENGKGGSEPVRASNDRPLKSLSDILKGKKGRFRQNLLGKRVDYSGRSVIVVGPTLKLHECGLPKEMALELFQPFLLRQLMQKRIVRTIVTAKKLIDIQEPIVMEILQQIMENHPILLNRAPTLHRLGIQAFLPKLVNGRAIFLHPLVCAAFNADFDGDQMGVHVPLSFQARAEAWKLMWSPNHLLSPATGEPILLPTQDMVLGCYYLSTFNSSLVASNLLNRRYRRGKQITTKNSVYKSDIKLSHSESQYFSDFNDLLKAYYQKKIDLHTLVWVRKNGLLETEKTLESPLEIRVNSFGQYNQIFSTYQYEYDLNGQKVKQYVRTTPGRVLLNQVLFT